MRKPTSEFYPYYVSLIDALVAEGIPVQNGRMFSMASAKLGGKVIGGLSGDDLVVKLTGHAHSDALSIPGATLFDPMGNIKVMKQCVQIPAAQQDRWGEFLKRAAQEK